MLKNKTLSTVINGLPYYSKSKIVIQIKSAGDFDNDLFLISVKHTTGWTGDLDKAYFFPSKEEANKVAARIASEHRTCFVQEYAIVYECKEEVRFTQKTN